MIGIRKFMGDVASCIRRERLVILLAEHLGRLRIFRVEQPAIHDDVAVLHFDGAEGDHGGVGRRRTPLGQIDLLTESPAVTAGAMLLETMSKMPALLRSENSTWLKVSCALLRAGSLPTILKSAAARRIFCAPRLVPVRTQSCAEANVVARNKKAKKKTDGLLSSKTRGSFHCALRLTYKIQFWLRKNTFHSQK